jgi:hypothetical protein
MFNLPMFSINTKHLLAMKNCFQFLLIFLITAHFFTVSAMQEADSIRNIHVGLIYPISSNGTKAASYTNKFSLHGIAGVSKNETGLALSGAATMVKGSASGALISGIFNYTGNNATGAQIAGFGNFTKHQSQGVQIAGVLNTSDSAHSQLSGFLNLANRAKGAQIAGVANITTHTTEGIQIAGFMNKSEEVNTQIAGVLSTSDSAHSQLSGFLNLAGRAKGAQIAGVANITTHTTEGIQIAGFMNKSEEVNTQIAGVINIAKKVKGAQIAGFINIAEESDYPIGIVNIIKNGEKTIGMSIDETNTSLAVFRSGGRILYGILGIGYNLDNKTDNFYGLEAGLGANLPISRAFRIRGELASQTLLNFTGITYNKGILRILPSIKIGNRLEIYGGPTLNRVFYESDQEYDYFGKKNIWKKYNDDNWQSIHLGYTAGIQFHL